ncbi:hypothetical protein BHYA_0231g00210 [Botrytis hyacinthi]|uniref:Uncharacterized protein n=1 Tax=Botrytis hyacinthi TaxID=278943 RepID=A0A4Z1GEZ4_9HELO|nr:hypothetical protein BHYA_0231g00210 [Botrytis hyacinthi]
MLGQAKSGQVRDSEASAPSAAPPKHGQRFVVTAKDPPIRKILCNSKGPHIRHTVPERERFCKSQSLFTL